MGINMADCNNLNGIWFVFPKVKQTFRLNTLNHTAIFSGANIVNTSQDFSGEEVTEFLAVIFNGG